MADISVQEKRGTDLSKVWAAAAIIAILALMGWLFSTESTTTTAVPGTEVDSAEVAAADAPVGAEAVELETLGSAPDQYVGQTIQTTVPVAVVLGQRGFWAEVPGGGNPFLVVVGPDVEDVGWIAPGGSASVVGSVQPVTDAEVDSWVTTQIIQEEARPQAAFATHYLSVSSATPEAAATPQ